MYLGLLLERHKIGHGLDSPSHSAQSVASSLPPNASSSNLSVAADNSVLAEKVMQSPQDSDRY